MHAIIETLNRLISEKNSVVELRVAYWVKTREANNIYKQKD